LEGAPVVENPAGMYGKANDAAYKYLVDFGFIGPGEGNRGNYLFLLSSYNGNVPEDNFVIK
jgi:hypothetical protein